MKREKKLSVEECKKHLKNSTYTGKEIEEIRDALYQFADILIKNFLETKPKK